MTALFKIVDSSELKDDWRACAHIKVDGLPLHLHKELEQINLQRKRLKEQLERLDAQAALIEAQRQGQCPTP